jgi:protein-disulfide isomerase
MRAWILAIGLAVGQVAMAADELPVGSSLGQPAGDGPPPSLAGLTPQVSLAGLPMLGNPSAPVTIVEFMDYECPFCQGYGQDTFPRLKARYIDTGQVRYVVSNYPLRQHRRARPAAVAAVCAEAQGKYWEMHEALLEKQGHLLDTDFDAHAERLELDVAAFRACRAERADAAWLDADLAAARRAGVSSTPSFMIGASRGDIARGRIVRGAPDFAAFEAILARYLPARP